jgi:hypothetical protein
LSLVHLLMLLTTGLVHIESCSSIDVANDGSGTY